MDVAQAMLNLLAVIVLLPVVQAFAPWVFVETAFTKIVANPVASAQIFLQGALPAVHFVKLTQLNEQVNMSFIYSYINSSKLFYVSYYFLD